MLNMTNPLPRMPECPKCGAPLGRAMSGDHVCPVGAKIVVLKASKPQGCDLCGKVAELRPYGPKGEHVCFECGMKDEEAAKRAFDKRMET